MSARTGGGGSGTLRQALHSSPSPVLALSLSSRLCPSPRPLDSLMKLASAAVADGRIRTFFLPAPAGSGAETCALAEGIASLGGEVVATISCAGREREGLLAVIADLRRAGVGSFLFVTGDMPAGVRPGKFRSLFDVDSVRLFMLKGEWGRPGGKGEEPFAGCAVAPFKALEAEVYWQYEKLRRKKDTGARFVVTQPGFDLERYGECLRYCRREEVSLPVFAGLLVPDRAMAEHLSRSPVPGVTLPQELVVEIMAERGDGRKRALGRAAAMMRSLRGMGCAGILLEGSLGDYSRVRALLDDYETPRPREKNSSPRSHFPLTGFRYFRRDREGSLSDDPAPLAPAGKQHPLYLLGHLVDLFAFKKKSVVSTSLEALCRFSDRGPLRTRALWLFEFLAKAPLYGCRMCGDCALYACGFICYVDRCPKKLLNGPCGGSLNGWCEVYPGRRRCLWVDVHRRLKVLGGRPPFPARPIPPANRDLYGTCSWINFFLGRDHQQRGRRGEGG